MSQKVRKSLFYDTILRFWAKKYLKIGNVAYLRYYFPEMAQIVS